MTYELNVHEVDYRAFIAYLPRLKERAEELDAKEGKSEDESLACDHLKFLVEFVSEEFADLIKKINVYLSHGEITFSLLWAILLRRTPLYTKCRITGEPRIVWLEVGLTKSADMTILYDLHAQWVEYNAQFHQPRAVRSEPKFGIAEMRLPEISPFHGAVKIKDLRIYPLEYHPNAERLKAKLLSRGKKWLSLQGKHHVMYYSGNAYYRTDSGEVARIQVRFRTTSSFRHFS